MVLNSVTSTPQWIRQPEAAWEAWTEYLEIIDGERAHEAQELAKQQLEAATREKQIRAQTDEGQGTQGGAAADKPGAG